MSTSKVFSGATLVSIPLGVLILLIWIAQLATLADLNGSDPAGNALAQAYGAAEIIVLWVLLAVLTIVAWTKGAMPGAAALAALILIPASGLAAITIAKPGAGTSVIQTLHRSDEALVRSEIERSRHRFAASRLQRPSPRGRSWGDW